MTPFNITAIDFAWLPLCPLAVVALAAIIVLLVGVRVRDDESEGLGALTLALLAVAFIFTLGLFGRSGIAFAGALSLDNFAAIFELLILMSSAVVILMSIEYVPVMGLSAAEYYALILFATLGMMLMAAGADLIVIFIGFEIMSISVYVLAGFLRRNLKSNEAALKYFMLGAFSTAFLLYGIALVYGATGTIKLGPISAALSGPMAANPLLLSGLGLMLVGFGFKVAAVPFHMWTPDAYEGAPTPVTAFMAVGVKLGAFAGFIRIFMVHLGPVSIHWTAVLWVIAALTMTLGNLAALMQTNIKRMLAYSAIAHAGYLLVGMTAAGSQAGGAIIYYLLGYAFTNLGAFAVVIALERRGVEGDLITDYRGLATRHPVLAAAMALFLFSLTGIPPLAGFVGKFYIFSAALNAGLVGLVIIAVINSVVSAYYYVSVIVAMYVLEGGVEFGPLDSRPALIAALSVAAIATVLIGIYPNPYMSGALHAFNSAFGATLPRTALMIP
ncbi:MAG TPA: NADH-quinone oxidoreductase subunit N [Candidatus Binataceae bacterium]|nr:NADH-quinone oxidoreductase subunit N [Candidatus Binataceae bacterium]